MREQCKRLAEVVRRVGIRPDPFTDPRYYPPKDAPVEDVVRYFLFIVAIDHRCSLPNRPFEGIVRGERFHGADLLYRLAKIKYEEDPDFFSPERMSRITAEAVARWLRVEEPEEIVIHDPDVRAFLLRDIAVKLLRLYDGRATALIEESKHRLKSWPEGGFIDRLRVFRAYEDPVEKKAYLLAKFLERRGILRPRDPQNMHVPVDNHLTRIALRTGIVEPPEWMMDAIEWRREATWEEDVILRMLVRTAWKLVADKAGLSPSILDDFLWWLGRKRCTREEAACERCPLREACAGARDPRKRSLTEHFYYRTWYY